jgi:hypothetical protein
MVGVRPSNEVTDPLEESKAKLLQDHGKLLEIGGAPFGILFPFCDFLVIHGGLGTTGEALRAGKPCLITGVLLFDQRFWGKRLFEMGCGPKPIHLKYLKNEIVNVVDKGLIPGNPWVQNAQKIAQILKETGNGDGIQLNVDTIANSCEESSADYKVSPPWRSLSSLRLHPKEEVAAPKASADGDTTDEEDGTEHPQPSKIDQDELVKQ